MFEAIRKRISATGVLAVVALVFAMTGGAYAASRVIIKNIGQISPSVQKKLKGAKGAAGAKGDTGPAGPAGPAGTAGVGTPGAEGKAGVEGKQGVPGVAGENGEKGEKGEPWTPNGVLPSKATETGTWSDQAHEASLAISTISFPVQLKEGLNTEHVHFVTESELGLVEQCKGTVEKPTAVAGNLCVYVGFLSEMEPTGFGVVKDPSQPFATGNATGVAGATIFLTPHEESVTGTAYGTWAVTAP
jgi:hypothetical protein